MTKLPNMMTQVEYAEYKGVHKSRVTQWKKDGRLVFSADGKFVLVADSDERLKQTADMNGYANSLHAAAERAKINEKIAEEKNKEKSYDELNELYGRSITLSGKEKSYDELKDEVCSTQLDLETKDADELFKNSRALKEKSAALQAAAEYEAYIGELSPKKELEALIFERARQFRDGMMASKKKLAPNLSGLTNIKEIEMLLDNEFRLLLDKFSDLPEVE